MLIHTLPTNDPVHKYEKCLVIPFTGTRTVLSTSPLNGGYQESLTAVFNNDINPGSGMECQLCAPTYREHLACMAEKLGLDATTAAGMVTAASMDNVSIKTAHAGDLYVTAVVTGGIDINGGRAGDPASWNEAEDLVCPVSAGTINIFLFFNCNLTKGALTRSLVTCTEAKTAALQELIAPSRSSMGIATGSGTDDTILVCDPQSPLCLTNAGKHSKLGELIATAVKAAVKEALFLQTGLSPQRQHHVLQRIDRFGITEDTLWNLYRSEKGSLTRADFSEKLHQLCQKDTLVMSVSLYVHLMDQLIWGMASEKEATEMGLHLLADMTHAEPNSAGSHTTAGDSQPSSGIQQMIRNLSVSLIRLLSEEEHASKKGLPKP